MQIRDAQSAALRRSQIARNLCELLTEQGNTATYDASTGVVASTDKLGRTSRLQLGVNGLPEVSVTPLGRISRVRYNDEALLTDLIEPSGRHSSLSHDEQLAPTRFARDGVTLAQFSWSADRTKNVVEFWDGSRAAASYSATGKPLSLTNRVGASQRFEYDENGRINAIIDGRDNATRFYFSQGKPLATQYADGRLESLEYDGQGRWTQAKLNGQLILEREADYENRPLKVTYADDVVNSFAWDGAGRILGAEGPDGASTFVYDDEGRQCSETNDDQTFGFEYDATGLLVGLVYPDGTRAVYGYDADKRLVSVEWDGAAISIGYDGSDRQRLLSASNQLTTTTQLAPSGKAARITTADRRTGAICFDTEYSYDAEDRLIARNDNELGAVRFVYDAESQLLGVAGPSGGWRESFAYDQAGNRVFGSGQQASVDDGNRLLSLGAWRCEYDERGNVVKLHDHQSTWVYRYDLKNQMTDAEGPLGKVMFKYDGLGRRVEKRSQDRTVRYVWCGEALAREIITTPTGESVRDYLYRPGSYEPLALRIDGHYYFYHNDHQGTPQRITDSQGRVVWAADYFAFGYAQVRVGTIENSLRFAGQYADVETGLHYNRFRYYSPLLGRYLSIDPVRLIGGNNLYAYAGNNPLNRVDPLGLWSVMGVVGAVAAVAAAVVLAPVALVAAPLLVAGGLMLAEAASIGSWHDFCGKCFLEGFGEAFLPGLFWGAVTAGTLAVIGAICAPAALIGGVLLGGYFAYSMLDGYFGWSGGVPFDQLTPNQKSKALGQLVGGTVGGLLGALGVGAIASGYTGTVPVEERPYVPEMVPSEGTSAKPEILASEKVPKGLSDEEAHAAMDRQNRQVAEEQLERHKKIQEAKEQRKAEEAADQERLKAAKDDAKAKQTRVEDLEESGAPDEEVDAAEADAARARENVQNIKEQNAQNRAQRKAAKDAAGPDPAGRVIETAMDDDGNMITVMSGPDPASPTVAVPAESQSPSTTPGKCGLPRAAGLLKEQAIAEGRPDPTIRTPDGGRTIRNGEIQDIRACENCEATKNHAPNKINTVGPIAPRPTNDVPGSPGFAAQPVVPPPSSDDDSDESDF